MGRNSAAQIIFALIGLAMLSRAHAASSAAPTLVHRVAILVGANHAATGLRPLRYAYRDADKMARVLSEAGGFLASDIHVLRDPEPDDVLALLDRQLAALRAEKKESLLFFYFSGHADSGAVYAQGRPLPLRALRDRLDDAAATVRIGMIDACRGGGWTRAKGLSEAAPFEINLPEPGLNNEGAAFIASSSGQESAHESDQLRGSFFTHYFVGGLLGAADQTGDGAVTLSEAFDYAKQLTIRDTATFAGTPQHPSFDLKLRGRQDLTLTTVASSPNVVRVQQTQGPLEIIGLQAGLLIAELPAGQRDVRLALPAGKYLIRRVQQRTTYALEFDVESGKELLLREQDLRPKKSDLLAEKGGLAKSPPYMTAATVEHGQVELREAIGVRYRDFSYNGVGLSEGVERSLSFIVAAVWGITDRLEWSIGTGAIAYRFGQRGRSEWIPWGGLLSWGLRYIPDSGVTFSYGLGLGLDVRLWLSDAQYLLLGAGASSGGAAGGLAWTPSTWRTQAGFGYGITLRGMVSFHLSAMFEQNLLYAGHLADSALQSPELDWTLRLGAVQSLGLRPLPLVSIHVNRWFSVDGYAGLAIKLRDRSLQEHYLVGTTFTIF